MSRQPFISVIIPVLNDAERLEKCLDALRHQTYGQENYEVIVIDNGPCAEVQNTVEEFTFCRLVIEPIRGTSRARNTGMRIAKGSIFAFTDADCIPKNDWLACGVSHILNNPKCGLVGGRVQMMPVNEQKPRSIELYDCALYLDQYKHVIHQKFAATANAFIPSRVFEKVGYMDTDIFPSEDEELGQRIHKAGFALTYAPDACVLHPALQTFPQLWRRTMRNMEGKVQYYQKQGVSSFVHLSWKMRHFTRMHTMHDWRCLHKEANAQGPLRIIILYSVWLALHIACIVRGAQLYYFTRLKRA